MKKNALILSLLFVLNSISLLAQIDNVELQKMFDDDQKSRLATNIDWIKLTSQDKEREKRIYELIETGQINTGNDYYHSAMILQHGEDTSASSFAIKLMIQAIELDSTINKWLLAAAIDRDLMKRKKPQIYGTQYIKKGDQNWIRYEIDTTVITDLERKRFNVETLKEQLEKERTMNLLSISAFYYHSKSVKETLRLIKSEFHEGLFSKYNTSENDLNSFAYELMNLGQTNEALLVFILNTELYPNSFNTFDSLGECYLNLGKTKKGLKAYKKSLELNPANRNARLELEKQ